MSLFFMIVLLSLFLWIMCSIAAIDSGEDRFERQKMAQLALKALPVVFGVDLLIGLLILLGPWSLVLLGIVLLALFGALVGYIVKTAKEAP